MEYRAWMNKRVDARSELAVRLKQEFYPDTTYSKVSMQLASLVSKIVFEGQKCWPDEEEFIFLPKLLKSFTREDLIDAVMVDDDRPWTKSNTKTMKRAMDLPSAVKVMREIIEKHKDSANAGQRRVGTIPETGKEVPRGA